MRLPDLVVMVHTRDKHQYREHPAITDSAKVISLTLMTFFLEQPLVCVLYCTDRCHRLGSQLWGWWTRTATPISSPTQCLAMMIVRTLSKCFSTSPSRLSWQAKRRENWNNSNDFPLMFPESDIRDGKGNGGSVIERGQGQRKTWKRR